MGWVGSWALASVPPPPPQTPSWCRGKPWLLGLLLPPSFSTPLAISPSSPPSTGTRPSWGSSRDTPPICCLRSSLGPTPSPLRSSWQVSSVLASSLILRWPRGPSPASRPAEREMGSRGNGSCDGWQPEGGSQRTSPGTGCGGGGGVFGSFLGTGLLCIVKGPSIHGESGIALWPSFGRKREGLSASGLSKLFGPRLRRGRGASRFPSCVCAPASLRCVSRPCIIWLLVHVSWGSSFS